MFTPEFYAPPAEQIDKTAVQAYCAVIEAALKGAKAGTTVVLDAPVDINVAEALSMAACRGWGVVHERACDTIETPGGFLGGGPKRQYAYHFYPLADRDLSTVQNVQWYIQGMRIR